MRAPPRHLAAHSVWLALATFSPRLLASRPRARCDRPLQLRANIAFVSPASVASQAKALHRYDHLVTLGRGSPPSRNPALLEKVVPRFVLDTQLDFPDAILLTQVGSFYESHFDQADNLAKCLGIKLTEYRYAGESYPLAGFPVSSLARHLKVLVNDCAQIVAIANQSPPTSSRPNELPRTVVRVVTPGTLVDEDFIDPFAPSYLLAVFLEETGQDEACELAWMDVSTGSYFADRVRLGELHDSVARVAPKEIVVGFTGQVDIGQVTRQLDDLDIPVRCLKDDSAEGPTSASSLVRRYLQKTLIDVPFSASRPRWLSSEPSMSLDDSALKALDIRGTRADGSAGALVTGLARTLTRPGRRLLLERLSRPSADLDTIDRRASLVACLHGLPALRQNVRDELSRLAPHDFSRLVQKIHLGRGNVQDLHSLHAVLESAVQLSRHMRSAPVVSPSSPATLDVSNQLDLLQMLRAALPRPPPTAERLDPGAFPNLLDRVDSRDVVGEEESGFLRPRWLLRPSHSNGLASLHADFASAKRANIATQERIKTRLGSPVKFRLHSRHGPVLYLKKASLLRNSPAYDLVSVGHSKDAQYALDPHWTQACAEVDEARTKIFDHEQQVIGGLLERVQSRHSELETLALTLADLDVAQGFATYASEAGWVRPRLSTSTATLVEEGRHPVAEARMLLSGDTFQPNTTRMGPCLGRIQIVTGPNNGGKSTYLRQVCTIQILAQAGSFVPARRAELGLVTACFTRLGASDDVRAGKGTFSLEMEETARVLRQANPSSLVVIDELGRGTTATDGTAIGLAVLLHLLRKTRCRVVFATHLHEIGDRLHRYISAKEALSVRFLCTGKDESTSRVLRPGINRASAAMQVAEQAGIPRQILALARVLRSS